MTLPRQTTSNKQLDNLKLLTQWLLNTSKNININPILNDSNQDSYRYRLISYVIRYPKIVLYVNNYLNNLYLFDNSKYTLYEWLTTFKLIFKVNNLKTLDRIYLSKYKPPKRISFKNEIKEFELNINDKVLSENELNELFRLYSVKIIGDDFYNNIKLINSGKDKVINKSVFDIDSIMKIMEEDPIVIESSKSISQFNNTLTKYIQNRLTCKNCILYDRPKYPIISNIKNENDKLDVIIVGDFPSKENFIEDYRHIKLLLEKYNLTYLATNLIVCNPEIDISNMSKVVSNCKEVTNHIHKQFKSNFKILIGTNVKKAFNITSPMTKVNGDFINNCFIVANSNYSTQYKTAIVKLDEFLEKYLKEKINRINIEEAAINTANINFNEDLQNYTLFDIKIINENLLYILIENNTGKKKYISENISYPIYIKKGNFRDCEYFTNDTDFVTYLTQSQKLNLSSLTKKQLIKEVLL